jgi:hypothetical protein
MSKTILQAIVDDVHYPVSSGNLENRLITRGLDGDDEFTQDIANGKEYKGTLADCLISLVYAPNFTEGNVTISLSDKDKIINIANNLYGSIGEDSKKIKQDEATVEIL